LCAILSDSISDPESRLRFVVAFNRAGGGQSTTGASGVRSTGGATTRATTAQGTKTGTVAMPLEAAYVEHVTNRLAIYIGPIAQVLTRKAARESRSRTEFVRRCADNLGTQERVAFLHELGYE